MKSNNLPGLGPVRQLLQDPSITEIMINGPNSVYIERDGQRRRMNSMRLDDKQIISVIDAMLAPTNRSVSLANPFVDFSLPDGSRVNVILPPLSVRGPLITIRKFSEEIGRIEDLLRFGTLNRRMADLLIAGIKGKLNMVFSGATGAGKTTTLNVLSSHIPSDERIITLEDTAELVLQQEHVVPLEVRVQNLEGKGEVSMRDLFKNSLRMRPDRIIVGEVRGGEAVDMIQAMVSGHNGTLGVLHAGSPADVIARLDVMMLSSGLRLPVWALHQQIGQALDLIIQHEQLVDGSRKITRLTEIGGVQDGEVILQDLFTFKHLGENDGGRVMGHWECSGVVPAFVENKMAHYRVDVPKDLFRPGTAEQAWQF